MCLRCKLWNKDHAMDLQGCKKTVVRLNQVILYAYLSFMCTNAQSPQPNGVSWQRFNPMKPFNVIKRHHIEGANHRTTCNQQRATSNGAMGNGQQSMELRRSLSSDIHNHLIYRYTYRYICQRRIRTVFSDFHQHIKS